MRKRALCFRLMYSQEWFLLIQLPMSLRYVGHVGWGGVCRLNMRRMDGEDCLWCCWETALWRLCIRGRCHGRWCWCQPRVINGRLLLWTGQVKSLGGLVLMVLNRTGCRMTSTMLALLLSGGSGRRLRMWRVWMQGGIRMCVLLSEGAGGNIHGMRLLVSPELSS